MFLFIAKNCIVFFFLCFSFIFDSKKRPEKNMGYEKISELDSIKPANEEKQTITDEVPAHLEPYLQTKPTFGLTDDQIIERRNQFGPNELTEKKRNKLLHFLSFCKHTKTCFIK